MTQSPFPSLAISRTALAPQGAFARAQAEFLDPDRASVGALRRLLEATQAGVVAHFYVDAELQAVLAACDWPHIHISDSLVMADRAVAMVEAGAKAIAVLGVDFMSENVRAMLDAVGHAQVPVWRAAAAPIGCSLAEAAESPAYLAYLDRAAQAPRALHVVYINTSLRTKAVAQSKVPTITCTSSNVVRTVLTAFAQVPDIEVFFGPDTYMGRNVCAMFERYATLPDEAIRALHPAHDGASLRRAIERLHHFEQGACIVHHLCGAEVVAAVRRHHAGAFHTAHLEVPGEMFALALEAARAGRGVVGSTSDILEFIAARLAGALSKAGGARLSFVLGTEAGMVTSVVGRVRALLAASGRDDVTVEIVFPVASEAVMQAPGSGLGIVPGVAGGEGCSTAGGCATCPYMKMNHLDALLDLLGHAVAGHTQTLAPFAPRVYSERIGGRTMADLGSAPILHMRAFGKTGRLPDTLVDDISNRHARS